LETAKHATEDDEITYSEDELTAIGSVLELAGCGKTLREASDRVI